MADIFGKKQQYKQTSFVTTDFMVLKVGNLKTGVEYLIQDINLQYSQPLNPLPEIGSSYLYFVPTRPMGNFSINRVVGKYPITAVFGPTGQGPWSSLNPDDNKSVMFYKIDSGGGIALSYVMTGFIIENYQVTGNANGLLLQESVSGRFASMEFAGEGAGGGVALSSANSNFGTGSQVFQQATG